MGREILWAFSSPSSELQLTQHLAFNRTRTSTYVTDFLLPAIVGVFVCLFLNFCPQIHLWHLLAALYHLQSNALKITITTTTIKNITQTCRRMVGKLRINYPPDKMALKDMEQSHPESDSQRCCVGHWPDFDSETAELRLNPGSFAAG